MRAVSLLAWLLAVACAERPPYVVLTVEDPGGVAVGWTQLAVGETRETLSAVSPDRHELPVSLTLTAKKTGEKTLWVEARDASGAALGRGTTTAKFAKSGAPAATVRLAKACTVDVECNDGLFCSGTETCVEGMCGAGENPCAANVECALSNCVDLGSGDGTCDVTVDHLKCPSGSYCNPLRGCVEGKGCQETSDCTDSYVCNGEEQCINLVCAPGLPPATNDGDFCTLDGCNDDRTAQGYPAVFHVALESVDGRPCTIPGTGVPGTAGVCVSAKLGCAISECGDGVAAEEDGEECDDGNTNDLDACRNTCEIAFCGDGVVQTDVEVCDDGGESASCNDDCTQAICGDRKLNTALGETCDAGGETAQCDTDCTFAECGDGVKNSSFGEACDEGDTVGGDGCSADCRKAEVCGDRYIDAGEDCDDGNTNAADGCDACGVTEWRAAAVIGGSVDAISVGLQMPQGVAVDSAGDLYIVDTGGGRIRKLDTATGVVRVIAGNGSVGGSGDGGPATSAEFSGPQSAAVDGLGHVYVADEGNHRIRRIDVGTGVISTVVGVGTPGFAGDGGAATAAQLQSPVGVAIDGLGTLYVADTNNHRIRKVDAVTGIITTIAGTGVQGDSGDGGAATLAQLRGPEGMALDGMGALYVAEPLSYRVRKITLSTGVITTAAGTGTPGYSGDNGAATSAKLYDVLAVAVDGQGNLYVADSSNSRVREVLRATGVIITVAGNGAAASSGDLGLATSASIRMPTGVALDAAGNLYIADRMSNKIRKVRAGTGIITTAAGSGAFGNLGDGGAATSAFLGGADGVALDGAGNLFIADTNNNRVRRVDLATGIIDTVAGIGNSGYSGDGGAATEAALSFPSSVALDSAGNLYIADASNQRVRRVAAATGVITTIAGTGAFGFAGDGGAATAASLNQPAGVAIDGAGNLYIADRDNFRVRMVEAGAGVIRTVAGTGVPGYTGDGGPATNARIFMPMGVAADYNGNFYIADSLNSRIRKVAAETGTITTVAGTGTAGFSGDGGLAISANLDRPDNVGVDDAGNLYIADVNNQRIRKVVAATGVIGTVAGSGTLGFAGDGGAATSGRLRIPSAVVVDGQGALYVTDFGNRVVRYVDPDTQVLTTLAGKVDPEGMGPILQATLADPRSVVWAEGLWLMAGGSSGTVQALRDSSNWLEVAAGRYPQSISTANLGRFRDNAFGSVGGVEYDAANNLIYLTESSANRVLVVAVTDPDDENTWTIAGLAGDASGGAPGFANGVGASARFRNPTGLYFDSAARILYVADTGNHSIRTINVDTGVVGTAFGTPATLGFFGDNGLATHALMYQPQALSRCANGDFFIADTGNNRVRRVHRLGSDDIMTTVLGDGTAASSGEGTPAWTFPVEAPLGLACDDFGNLFVTSTSTVRMLPASDTGVVDGDGPVQTIYGGPPRDSFPASISECLTGIAVVDAETVRITDACAGLLVELQRTPAP